MTARRKYIYEKCLNLICYIKGALGAKVGLALTQVMASTGILQMGIRQSSEVANQLTSVERIAEYGQLTPEQCPKRPLSQQLAKSWPEIGTIELRNVKYRYCVDAEPVLRELNFSVRPKEKVGRTGAGKSSLIGAIFRMAITEGAIIIDVIDTSTFALSDLQSRISIIPQDPFLFSGTLRMPGLIMG